MVSAWQPVRGSHETERGYTGHEHLDNVGLIHMNGRVQDPVLGRFISADPFVQAPFSTQSHNRYSYVWNNPASMIDPSGFGALDFFCFIPFICPGRGDDGGGADNGGPDWGISEEQWQEMQAHFDGMDAYMDYINDLPCGLCGGSGPNNPQGPGGAGGGPGPRGPDGPGPIPRDDGPTFWDRINIFSSSEADTMRRIMDFCGPPRGACDPTAPLTENDRVLLEYYQIMTPVFLGNASTGAPRITISESLSSNAAIRGTTTAVSEIRYTQAGEQFIRYESANPAFSRILSDSNAMLQLSDKWGPKLIAQPETGMGYQVASVLLRDGSRFDQVLIEGGYITRIRGRDEIPFVESEIADIVVTHDKWDFAAH